MDRAIHVEEEVLPPAIDADEDDKQGCFDDLLPQSCGIPLINEKQQPLPLSQQDDDSIINVDLNADKEDL